MRNLFFRLPHDSETKAEIAELTPEYRLWSPDMYMLANIVDAVMYTAWSIQAVNSKNKPKAPKPIKRPMATKKPEVKRKWPGKTIVVKEGNADG